MGVQRALRLGMIWPGGGAEHEYYQFAEALDDRIKIFLSCSRVGGEGDNDHDVDALLQTARVDWLEEAARRLICLKPDVVFWACTSGSFIVGRAGAETQVSAIARTTGAPAGSTSLAFIAALETLGTSRVSVLATYPEPASRAFVKFLGEFGVEVLHMQWLDAASGWDAALLDPEIVTEKAREAAIDGAEALLVPDTAMPSLHLVERLERATERPVLTANAVTLWQAMKLAGGAISVKGYGTLLAHRDVENAA
ncbi:MAG: maleate cis-trans isomerase [Gammaproteobacteria bacterium]|nr:maleate cis-trans isomerase [Gammaproteobacteria bacterium]